MAANPAAWVVMITHYTFPVPAFQHRLARIAARAPGTWHLRGQPLWYVFPVTRARARAMTEKREAIRATYLVIGLNLLLLALKAKATSVSESFTVFSETVNSLTDVAASIAVLICVRVGRQEADAGHPFGHGRAEPIAGLIVALFAGIMGWEVIRRPLTTFGQPPESIYMGGWALPVLIVTVLTKAAAAWYLVSAASRLHSPALRASAVDCRNDVLVGLLAVTGVVLGAIHPLADLIVALAVGGYILYQAYEVGLENIRYLMGSRPDDKMLAEIHQVAARLPKVRDVADIKAHYVGNFIHVELAILVDPAMATQDSHDLAEATRAAVESIPAIECAFIHVEPGPAGVAQPPG